MSNLILEPILRSSLTNIDSIEPITFKDYNVLDKIRDVLVEHDCLDRFGISLLHKHFDISNDEQLIEYTDFNNRTLTTKVEKNDTIEDSKTIETMWSFHKTDNAEAITVCVIRCLPPGHNPYHVKEAR